MKVLFLIFREGVSMCVTLNVCEAFIMTCRQAAAIKPIVWGTAEFGRLAANKRMHGVENAALFNVPHIWSPSRNTPIQLRFLYTIYMENLLSISFFLKFILHSYKVSYIIRIDKRKFFGAGWPTQLEFPTGGKVRDPRKAADPVTDTSQNSGTDSKVWMREEHE